MARSRSTALIAIGAAVFVVGAALTFLALRDDDEGDVRATTTGGSSSAAAAEATPAAETVVPVKIPDGKEAVAVQVPRVPGLGGYAKVGDRVNVYGTFADRQPTASVKGPPLAKLVATNIEVLGLTSIGTDADGGAVTYLLAVNADEAEKVIYLTSFEGVWLSLTRDGAPPVVATPGRNAANAA